MSFRKLAILAIAGLTAACGAPVSQSVSPATLQSAVVSNGRLSPNNRCNYLKMEPLMKTTKVHEELGITPVLRTGGAGYCESSWRPAEWHHSGGGLLIRKEGKEAIFFSSRSGTYTVTAHVSGYVGQTTITVNH